MSLKLFLYSAQIICSYILGSLDSLNSKVVALKKHSPTHEPSISELRTVHSGAPQLRKSTHPRKFGNHVTDRPSDRPTVRPHHRHTNVYSYTF